MIASILLGVGGMINFLVPLMIGARDMAFPRLNAFSFWIAVPAAVLLVAGIFVGGWDTGWVAYPPHSTSTNLLGVNLFLLGFYVIGFSSIAGAINVIVTVATMRAGLRGAPWGRKFHAKRRSFQRLAEVGPGIGHAHAPRPAKIPAGMDTLP